MTLPAGFSEEYLGPPGATRVLVVDDDESVLFLLHEILAEEFAVALVDTGEKALPFLKHNPPDVLLADKNLPDISGLTLLEKVKELNPDTEVIIITGYASLESSIEALRLGAYDYLLKPFRHIDIVVEKVRRASEKKLLLGEHRRAQQALQESEEVYRTLVETSPDAIALLDLEGKILRVNHQVAVLYGWESPMELIGRDGFGFVAPEYQEDAKHNLRTVLEAGSVNNLQYSLPRKDGSFLVAELSASLIRDVKGKPKAIMTIVRDITERKRLEAQLAQADRMVSLGMLAAGMAHEINNPLAFILYNLESLAEDLPKLTSGLSLCWSTLVGQLGPDKAAETLGDAREFCEQGRLDELVDQVREAAEGARRVRDIVRDLKTFSRVDEDRRFLVKLDQVIESTINMAFNEIRFRARLIKEYGDTPPVMASEGRLCQVFLNLLLNAAQAVDESNLEHNQIRVRTWVENGEVLVEVQDTGRGIAPENLDRLFDPFYTTKPKGTGSGLGLSICHKIISSYGGRIEVESTLGKGSRFIIHLPAAADEAAVAPGIPTAEKEDQVVAHGRILVVDDEPTILSIIRRLLNDEHDVVAVESVLRAKQLLEKDTRFDLILCDLMMPDTSGMDLFDWLLERSPDLARRMVFMTGGAFTPRATEFVRKAQNLQIEKPFDLKYLKTLINKLLTPSAGPGTEAGEPKH